MRARSFHQSYKKELRCHSSEQQPPDSRQSSYSCQFFVLEHFSRHQNSSPALDGVTFIETLCRWSGNSPEGTLRKHIINFFPFQTAQDRASKGAYLGKKRQC